MSLQFSTFTSEDEISYVTFVGPDGPQVTDSNHPNYDHIVLLLERSRGDWAIDPQEVSDLFNIEATINRRFERLSERVTVKNGRIYFDGDVVHNTVTDQILRFLNDGVADWEPLVRFWEKLATNPQEDARDRSFDWLNAESVTITQDGDIVGYKSVHAVRDENGDLTGEYESDHAGPAVVNDEEHFDGRVPNNIGSVIEMARGQVTHDPSKDCAFGLHIGTYKYAENYTGDTVLEVIVNPRDIVSVPSRDVDKMRVCRYTVIGPVDNKYEEAVRPEPLPVNDRAANPPSKLEFNAAKDKAKAQKKGFSAYAKRLGWEWNGVEDGDVSNRLNWTVPAS